MSYVLMDRSSYLGDLATTRGYGALREACVAKPVLRRFLDTGKLDREDVDAAIAETKGSPALNGLRQLLQDGEAPFLVSDGMADESNQQ